MASKINWYGMLEGLPYVGGLFSAWRTSKEGKYEDIKNQAVAGVNAAIAAARNKGQKALDEVLNALSRLDFVSTSPTIRATINKERLRLQNKEKSLRNDLSEIDKQEVRSMTLKNPINDESEVITMKAKKRAQEYANQMGGIQNEIKKIEQRL